jgi:diphthamide synthase (EF-2-diphthine--ammonia ligase)
LFPEDVRRYREERLAGTGLTPLFPLFGIDTAALAREMIAFSLAARITRVNPLITRSGLCRPGFRRLASRRFTANGRPCGECGELHSFAYAGPMFSRPIPIQSGVVVERDGFVFSDLTLG